MFLYHSYSIFYHSRCNLIHSLYIHLCIFISGPHKLCCKSAGFWDRCPYLQVLGIGARIFFFFFAAWQVLCVASVSYLLWLLNLGLSFNLLHSSFTGWSYAFVILHSQYDLMHFYFHHSSLMICSSAFIIHHSYYNLLLSSFIIWSSAFIIHHSSYVFLFHIFYFLFLSSIVHFLENMIF